jgi:hypothetical protein
LSKRIINMTNSDPWQDRFYSVARAQIRYLYILFVGCVFYYALANKIQSQPNASIKVPIIEMEIDGATIMAWGPPGIGFLLLAALGTFPALRNAYKRMSNKSPWEAYDLVPTAIDFVVYARSRNSLYRIGLLAYPIVLTLAYVEGIWLFYLSLKLNVPQKVWHLIPGGIPLLLCLLPLVHLWIFKVRQIKGTEPI